jgi:FkbM family methyltransferase
MKGALASAIAALGRLYPLKSGCGYFANAAPLRWLDPPPGTDVVARIAGGRAVVPADDYVGRAMRFFGDLDPKVSWVIDRAVLPGDIAVDVGGNLGLVTLRMAMHAGPSGMVHTFEPQPRMLHYLRRTLALNPGLRISLHGIALGAEPNELLLEVPSHNAGAATFLARGRPSASSIRVPVRPMAEYCAEAGIARVDVMKIDVEGFEAMVLEGARPILEGLRPPRAILFEQHQPSPDSPAVEILRACGYTIFALPRRYFRVQLLPVEECANAHDFVAVHRDCAASVKRALGIRLAEESPTAGRQAP